jgi:N-acetylglucosaminyldiphosphoundecaprenol N-acetyl-beta-D-mannosaminyltransferase
MQPEPKPDRKTGVLLGIPLGCESLASLTRTSLETIDHAGPQRVFVCANAHSLVVAQSEPDFKTALGEADVVVADGIGVSIMGRILGIDVGARIAGEKYFWSIMRALEAKGNGRIFFFGSSPEVLEKIAKRFKTEFPGLHLCGTLSPPFRPWTEEENARMIAAINAAKPDVLWVGMTAPKQEKWVHKNRAALNVPLIGSIGAVFDFFAGTTQSPPNWVRTMGLESFYLLIKKPRRTWRRVFITAPKFVLYTLMYRATARRNR